MISAMVTIGCLCNIFLTKYSYHLLGLLFSIGGFGVLIIFFTARNDFAVSFNELPKKKYEKTSLTDLNTEDIKTRLVELMKIKKYFADEEVNLDDIADELMIGRNQLSRILNEYYGKNFYQFINYYRIEEAKKLLVENFELSIIDIAFEVGFKSKSVFYKQFQEATQQTPSSFRKLNQK